VSLRFEKWEGLGNDFLLVQAPVEAPAARRLCDRRRGVGADGVLVLEAAAGGGVRMTVLNADGSRPEMCGNGLRCVAAYWVERRGGREAVVLTDAGERRCEVERRADGSYDVRADGGRARVQGELRYEHAGRAWRFLRVDVGNPHAVSFDPFEDADLDAVGPALEHATAGGINVELCRVRGGGRLEVLVWERGVGRTLACGTGACATAAAAVHAGHVGAGSPVVVALPGGELAVVIEPATGTTRMRGPARRVFAGEIDL
jgi:diaminopimelate epimerase